MPRRKDPKTLSTTQKKILSRHGLDPKNFELVKETYGSLYVRDKRNGLVKILYKNN